MFTRRRVLAGSVMLAGAGLLPGAAVAQAAAPKPYALDDFFKPTFARDAALSPDGTRIAYLHSVGEGDARKAYVDMLDAADPAKRLSRTTVGSKDAFAVEWASEDRLLIWADIPWKAEFEAGTGTGSRIGGAQTWKATARRVVAIGADGSKPASLFSDRRVTTTNFNLGLLVDLLPDDPQNVLMMAWHPSYSAVCLFRVNVITGQETMVEKGGSNTVGWHTANGVPVFRIDWNDRGTVERVYARAPGANEWKLVRRTVRGGLPDFIYVGPTDDPAVILAALRVEGEDTKSVRKLDLRTLAVGDMVAQRPSQDVIDVFTDERGRYLGARYLDDRVAYDFVDPTLGKHFSGMNAFFGRECNVTLTDVDAAQNRFLARVSGPREPGAYYYYDKAARRLENLGSSRPDMAIDRLAPSSAIKVKTRDGATITAYLTQPIGGAPGPLVVMPHGGPEVRDQLSWDRQVQVLAAQGWWVLQPNFRGSGGYGHEFAKAGWGRWGGRMQEDVEDAVAQVIAEKKLDADRVAIMGASYGGYAALMGAVRRPDLYKAAISICGVGDLSAFLDYARLDDSEDKEIYRLWINRIGDPQTDAAAIATASPAVRAGEIRCPVLLVHGKNDQIVPIRQSRLMEAALRKAGKSVELVEVPDAGHGDWEDKVEKDLLTRYVALLGKAFA